MILELFLPLLMVGSYGRYRIWEMLGKEEEVP